jgi:hypothetical protein
VEGGGGGGVAVDEAVGEIKHEVNKNRGSMSCIIPPPFQNISRSRKLE